MKEEFLWKMGNQISLPYRKYKSTPIIQIPQHIFGKRIQIQAHTIKPPKRGKDILDGHGCYQTEAKGDIKFFSLSVDISNI